MRELLARGAVLYTKCTHHVVRDEVGFCLLSTVSRTGSRAQLDKPTLPRPLRPSIARDAEYIRWLKYDAVGHNPIKLYSDVLIGVVGI